MSGAVGSPKSRADWHALTASQAWSALDATSEGLTGAAAADRLRQHGPNQVRLAPQAGLGKILVNQLRSVTVALLAAAALLALVLGDRLDAAAVGAVLVLNALLGVATELRAHRALAALRRLDVNRATVVRDHRVVDVDARELVPGDVIELEAGVMVPADARLLSGADLRLVESALTGESIPVTKRADTVMPRDTVLAERANLVYKATAVVSGHARALVFATGPDTEVGRIGGLVSGVAQEKTPLEQKLDTLGRQLAVLAIMAALAVAVIVWLRDPDLGRALQLGIALGVAAVPEGLPAVATITLALGVHRMARRHALVRRLPAVETLGSVTVICTDKTGTLTAGTVTATVICQAGRELDVRGETRAPDAGKLLRAAALANRADLEVAGSVKTARGDPTEIALLAAAARSGVFRAELLAEMPEIAEVPFSSERRWMATIHRAPDGALWAYVKGATPVVVERCATELAGDGSRPLDAARSADVLASDAALAERGLRVLAIAAGRVNGRAEQEIRGLELLGLVGMIDPPARGVAETISAFRGAGIRTVMITGDHRLTALAVARELGLAAHAAEVLDGSEIEGLSEAQLTERLPEWSVFSRITPDQKLRIITAYQRQGERVAMIGDGINDAAALRKADIGVAMGGRGTDVAKEVSAVVLQDDRFQTIAAAIEEGRVIFDNIRKFVFYLFSCNLAEVMLLLVATVLWLPLPLLPLQILWLNLVTDTFPALALAVEPGERDLMKRPPRDPGQAIMSSSFLREIAFYAALITLVSLAALVFAMQAGAESVTYARTMTFMTLAAAQAFHLGNARSGKHVLGRGAFTNRMALAAVVLVAALQVMAVHYAPLARVLGTVPLAPRDWLVVLALGAVPAVVGQVIRVVRSHPPSNRSERRITYERNHQPH